jgi:hypothetical protein
VWVLYPLPLLCMDAKKKKGPEANTAATAPATNGSKALKVFRIDDVSASVFARDRQIRGESRTFYSVTFSRSYKDSAGQWRYTKWFDLDDLGRVVTVAQQASDYIHGLPEHVA